MLATDWGSPSGSTLGRISDARARQFWDPKHLVSQDLSRIASAKGAEPKVDCCKDKGFFWDEAILYAPHTKWKDMPVSDFWNGPVWKIIPDLEKAMHNYLRLPGSKLSEQPEPKLGRLPRNVYNLARK